VRLGCPSLGEVSGFCDGDFLCEGAFFGAGTQINDAFAHIQHSSSGAFFTQMYPISVVGVVAKDDLAVGGLHHRYERRAA
jgi:hypothetical protein